MKLELNKLSRLRFNGIKKHGFKKRYVIIGLLIIVVAIGGNSVLKNKKVVEAPAPVKNVKTQKVAIGSLSSVVDYSSKFDPIQEIQVFSKTGGKISSLNVEVGDKVTKGQVLFTIDAPDLQAQLQIQQAALTASQANLSRTSLNAEQILNKSTIAYKDAKDNYEKTKALYDAGAVSKQDLNNAKTKYDNDAIDLKAAQDDLATAASKAQVEQAKASVNSAQIQLDNATVTSPISGVVSVNDVKVGGIASSQSGSVTVMDASNMIAEISVPDIIISKIQTGQKVPISINASKDKIVSGVIEMISPNANSKDNSYLVKIKIDNSQNDLVAGMFIKVSLPAENKENILMVPNESIRIENNVNYLYAMIDGRVKKIAVTVGISDNKNTEVSGNITEGMDIITEGQSFLNEGEQVNSVQ